MPASYTSHQSHPAARCARTWHCRLTNAVISTLPQSPDERPAVVPLTSGPNLSDTVTYVHNLSYSCPENAILYVSYANTVTHVKPGMHAKTGTHAKPGTESFHFS